MKFKRFIIPGIVFVLSIITTMIVWGIVSANIHEQLSLQFQKQTDEIISLVENKMTLYTSVLYGVQGLFSASQHVTREEWLAYLGDLDTPERYPGISGVIYIERVAQDKTPTFPYPIHPLKNSGDYYPLTYTAATTTPIVSTTTAIGFDMSSDPERWEAMSRAVKENQPIASAVVQTVTAARTPLFIVYEPLYNRDVTSLVLAERERSIIGFVAVTFRPDALFGSLIKDPIFDKNIGLVVHDALPDKVSSSDLLFSSTASTSSPYSNMSREEVVTVAGRTWTLTFYALPEYQQRFVERYTPIGILLAGSIISALLAFFVYSLANSRQRAMSLAHGLTKDLEASKKDLQSFLDGLTTFAAKISPEGKILFVNKIAQIASGLGEKAVGFDFFRGEWFAYDAEVLKRVNASFKKVLQGSPVHYNERIKVDTPDGKKIIDIDFSMIPVLVDGAVRYVIAEGRDITKNREIEKQLEQEQVKDETLLRSIGEGLVFVDMAGTIQLMSDAAQHMLGWKLDEVKGKSLVDITPMQDARGKMVPVPERPITRTLTHAATTSSSGILEPRYYVRKDKTKFPISITVNPVLLGGKLIGAVEIFRDISEEYAIEKSKSDFVTLASHQLRTPLSATKWFTEMLLDGDAGNLSTSQREYLEEIFESNRRMESLINELLNASRLELDSIVVESKPMDILQTSHQLLAQQVGRLGGSKKLTIKEEYNLKNPVLSCDETLLRIIFNNVFSNACKYTPDGGSVTVSIQYTRATTQHKKGILITVTDTGYGIPKQQQDKIFSKLFRAENIKDKDTDGTGLGLYVVKLVLKHIGGDIWFESAEGEGSTFYIVLPQEGMGVSVAGKKLVI